MFELRTLLILIPGLPLLSAILTAVMGPRWLRASSHGLTILALGASFLCSLGVVGAVASRSAEISSVSGATSVGWEHLETLWTWVQYPRRLHLARRTDGALPDRRDPARRWADGDDAADGDVHCPAGGDLRSGLHARRSRLLAILCLRFPVRVLDDHAGPGQQLSCCCSCFGKPWASAAIC